CRSVPDIFECEGEQAFRRIETEAVRKCVLRVRSGCPTVVALGGGAFVSEENYELLEDHGVTVWLDCPFDVVCRRIEGCQQRPLARDPERFCKLYEVRRVSYARADYRVDAADGAEATADAIEALPIF
ncbi:MAG TPA: shikimate kinase, partial [Bryobacteraceae bacterium]